MSRRERESVRRGEKRETYLPRIVNEIHINKSQSRRTKHVLHMPVNLSTESNLFAVVPINLI